MLSYLCTEEGYAMKRRMWMALMLALVLTLPCFAMAEDEAFVIKKWDSYKKLAAMLDEAGKPAVVDITKQAISLSQLEQLHADYPETRFLYRLRVFKKNYLWDSDELDFGWNEFKDMDEMMAYLQYFPNVTSVKCLGSLFTGDEMERFVTAYPDVKYLLKVKVAHHQIRTDITAFCTKHALYTENRHDENDLSALKYCRDLVALDFGHNAVTSLEFLRELPKLQILICVDNQITDLSPLESQDELMYLEVFLNEGVEDISVLSKLPKLIDLHIGQCNISDVSPLFELKNLDRLWLPGNPVSEADVQALRDAMPNTTINTTALDHPTAEGWRQNHPRYLKIAEMFKNDKYVPFP